MTRTRKTYPSDLSDQEWEIIKSYLPQPQPKGSKENVEIREVVNGINYWLHEGCQWRALPHDFPCWQTVYSYFRKWQRKGVWQQIHQILCQDLRRQMGREETPSAAVIDSQSVKTGAKRGRSMALTAAKKCGMHRRFPAGTRFRLESGQGT